MQSIDKLNKIHAMFNTCKLKDKDSEESYAIACDNPNNFVVNFVDALDLVDFIERCKTVYRIRVEVTNNLPWFKFNTNLMEVIFEANKFFSLNTDKFFDKDSTNLIKLIIDWAETIAIGMNRIAVDLKYFNDLEKCDAVEKLLHDLYEKEGSLTVYAMNLRKYLELVRYYDLKKASSTVIWDRDYIVNLDPDNEIHVKSLEKYIKENFNNVSSFYNYNAGCISTDIVKCIIKAVKHRLSDGELCYIENSDFLINSLICLFALLHKLGYEKFYIPHKELNDNTILALLKAGFRLRFACKGNTLCIKILCKDGLLLETK